LEQTRRPDHHPGDTPAQGGGLLNSWFGLKASDALTIRQQSSTSRLMVLAGGTHARDFTAEMD
jgi:hypothetical protein